MFTKSSLEIKWNNNICVSIRIFKCVYVQFGKEGKDYKEEAKINYVQQILIEH